MCRPCTWDTENAVVKTDKKRSRNDQFTNILANLQKHLGHFGLAEKHFIQRHLYCYETLFDISGRRSTKRLPWISRSGVLGPWKLEAGVPVSNDGNLFAKTTHTRKANSKLQVCRVNFVHLDARQESAFVECIVHQGVRTVADRWQGEAKQFVDLGDFGGIFSVVWTVGQTKSLKWYPFSYWQFSQLNSVRIATI